MRARRPPRHQPEGSPIVPSARSRPAPVAWSQLAWLRFRAFLRRESEATGLPLGPLLAVSGLVHLAVMALAVNPWHPDEHFQILEFAWARAGLAPLDQLPWEWDARIRPTLQPALALGALRLLRAVGMETPFPWMFLLRAGTLVASLAVLLRVMAHVGPGLSRAGRAGLWITGLSLWFLPLFLFRFSSENLAGLCFAAALTLLVFEGVEVGGPAGDAHPGPTAGKDLAGGALLGLAFVFRFPMAFAVAPVLLWVALRRREGLRAAARAVGAAAGAVALASLVDAWFYGGWVFTPWRYVHANLVDGVAATFGTEPWYWYGLLSPVWMAPPLGLAVALMVVAGLAAYPGSAWSWAFVAFFVGHSLVAHKELRFLLPLIYLLPVLVGRGVDMAARTADWTRGGRRWVAPLLLTQNGLLLLLVLTPAPHRGQEVDAHFLRWLWTAAEATPADTVYVLDEAGDPYLVYGNPANVYRHPRVLGIGYVAGSPVPARIPATVPPERLLLLTRGGRAVRVAGAAPADTAYVAEAGYRAMARRLGANDAAWLHRLEAWDGWPSSPETRHLIRLRRTDETVATRPEGVP